MILIAIVFIAWLVVSVPAALLLGALLREVEVEVKHRDR